MAVSGRHARPAITAARTARTRRRRRRARRRRRPAGRRAGLASSAPRPALADRSSARSQAGLVGTTRARPEFRVMGPALGADMGQSNPVLAGAGTAIAKATRLAVRLLDQATPAMPAGSQPLPCPRNRPRWHDLRGGHTRSGWPPTAGQIALHWAAGSETGQVRQGNEDSAYAGAGFTQSLTGWAATRPAR